MKKVLYFGTPDIAVKPFLELFNMDSIEVIGVVTPPEKFLGRKKILTPSPVQVAADKLGIPVYHAQKKREVIKITQTLNPDLNIVIAFGVIFPEEALNYPIHGTVNVHFSLLPKYRGASPVQSAILAGDTNSGIAIQRMVYDLDAGDLIHTEPMDIKNMTTATAWEAMSQRTAEILPGIINRYIRGEITLISQDHEAATKCGKFVKSDGLLDPREMTAEQIYRMYLAFTPWPTVRLNTLKGEMKLLKLSLTRVDNGVMIHCKNNTKLWIIIAQIPGKKPQNILDILRGNAEILDIL